MSVVQLTEGLDFSLDVFWLLLLYSLGVQESATIADQQEMS